MLTLFTERDVRLWMAQRIRSHFQPGVLFIRCKPIVIGSHEANAVSFHHILPYSECMHLKAISRVTPKDGCREEADSLNFL